MYTNKKIKIENKYLFIETGKIAKNTLASIFAEQDGTALIATIVHKENKDYDFFPLKVDYLERHYANGKIPGNYLKREGRPSEREILISRLIDRSIRPMFPKTFFDEVHVSVTVLSINPEVNPDIIAIIATSVAISISGLPFNNEISAARVIYNNDKFIINPLMSEMLENKLELVITGTKDKITMIESGCNEISEEIFFNALSISQDIFKETIKEIIEFKNLLTTNKIIHRSYLNIENIINESDINKIKDIYIINDDLSIKKNVEEIEVYLLNKYDNKINKKELMNYISDIEKIELRNKILKSKKRLDNRNYCETRIIDIDINFLKKTHGSVLFTRGETQAIVTTTLGVQKDAQTIDCAFNENKSFNFMLHYNFPSYAVNEIGSSGIVKRREIGHGNLAKKALDYIIPTKEEFPYVIRLVSEITESNGSSSMATVCGGSLALMSAGVPIKKHIAGIAMGLILEDSNTVILTDISGKEDNIGDMDFKITGSEYGITAIQMDLKIPGITLELIKDIIKQGKTGLSSILNIMNNKISKSLDTLSPYVPKIKKIKIEQDKIKNIIGKSGTVIRGLTEKYNCKIDINDDGLIIISSKLDKNINGVIEEINNITKEIEIGTAFNGKVMKLTQFGAFINIKNKKDGLLHITKINKHKSVNLEWEIYEGMLIEVIVSKIDNNGKISLRLP